MRPPLALLALLLAFAPASGGSILGEEFNQEESEDYSGLPMLRLSLEGGLSQWIIPDDSLLTSAAKGHVDNLQLGHDLSVDAVCYFLPRGGVGLTWIWFLSRAESEDLVYSAGGPAHDIRERVSLTYIGPSFWTRIHAGRFGLAHAGFGAGYLGFLYTWNDNGQDNRAEAQTFALVTSLGWDFSIMRWIGLGINGRFVFSNIAEMTYNGQKIKAEDPDNLYMWYNYPLYRLELNAGLRFFL